MDETRPPVDPPEAPVDEYEALHELMSRHNLLSLFEHLTFRQKVDKVLRGLKADKHSGDYKYARLQVQRLSAPLCALLVPVIGVLVLSVLAGIDQGREQTVQVDVYKPRDQEKLEEPEDIEEPIEPPEPVDVDFTPDTTFPSEITDVVNAPQTDVSPQPAPFDAVLNVKSPVIMRGIVANRNAGMRGRAMSRYGGGGSQDAVLRALRWLKVHQNSDGSWPMSRFAPAATSLALLAYLGYGVTPSSPEHGPEFGETVEKAIRWLVENQEGNGHFKGRDGHDYVHPIATYALSEAYAMTKVPMVRYAVEKALPHIIEGQNATGGWDYNMKPSDRDDTSYMGWCAQALKAAKMANMADHPQFDAVYRNAVNGFKKNAHPEGGFGYTSPERNRGLTGVGVLCMQLLGAANDPDCVRGLARLDEATFVWPDDIPASMTAQIPGTTFNKNYYWYYITQAKFHAGGSRWDEWNAKFKPTLINRQTRIKGQYEYEGVPREIGFWDMPEGLSGRTDGTVMNTALCTLQLEVYYRYLPTFQTPEVIEEAEAALAPEADEIQIEINI